MRAVTLQELNALKEEYLATLDNTEKDEWYTTNRGLASAELNKFLSWLAVRLSEGVANGG
jgi:hypothetical protein